MEGEIRNREERQERKTGISEVVGEDLATEERFLAFYEQIFEDQKLDEYEIPKTKEDIEVVEGILEKMPEFVKRYDGKPVPLKLKHVHFFDAEKIPFETGDNISANGFYHPSTQSIGIVDQKSILVNARAVVHEVLHFNSFLSVQSEGEGEKPGIRRSGFEIKTFEKEIYFYDINEAVIEELASRFHKEYFSSIAHLSEAEVDSNLPPSAREFVFAYPEEREKLQTIIRDICFKKLGITPSKEDYEKKSDEEFEEGLGEEIKIKLKKLKEEIFNLFAKAVMSGRLLPVAREIEKTYGKGSFIGIGEQTKEKK